ncbi:hypothetical protein [Phenylobacterium sp.]|uniref:hypothetical protein n=1 Tax=Phenylobacterium sp. TaxID=1871053 RepID=UPI002E36AFD1|nr:hypothetical protein [Phenylobacterium sp.]HEX4710681.1 hypothetical protein [Phenylobacterium sp.]
MSAELKKPAPPGTHASKAAARKRQMATRPAPRKSLCPRAPQLAGAMDEMLRVSDGGAVLIAAATLDHALRVALEERLVADGVLAPEFLDAGAPLGTFQARVTMAYGLKIVRWPVFHDLQTIHRILEAFVAPREVSFDNGWVRELVGQLSTVVRWRAVGLRLGGPKAEFAYTVRALWVLLVQDASCIC